MFVYHPFRTVFQPEIAVHGPFLELYDLEKFYSDEFNSREYEPIRTRVFEVCVEVWGKQCHCSVGLQVRNRGIRDCTRPLLSLSR